MNTVFIILLTAFIFCLAYLFYAKKIESIWQIDPKRPTPAITKFDGVDYVPARNWLVLFGHHFSSIAGAGPIIGPIIGVMLWGWGPVLVWVILGAIFFGGIHDFGSLIISIREEGVTIGDIASKSISHKAKIILSVFIWLALILVIAVFAYLGADTLVTQPKIVIPSLGIIPVAVLVGLGLYRFKLNSVAVTIAGLCALVGLIALGNKVPVTVTGNAQNFWLIILLIYCFFASIVPVNILLQPRDYLSSFLLIAGILVGLAGILVSHPAMNAPVFISAQSSIGFLWPMMFITVACGANSGFHSLISSGTTSKQIANECHAKRIGFGAMLLEGFLAALVVVIVVGGLSAAEFHQHIIQKTTPVRIYGLSFGHMTQSFLGPYGGFIALTILNVFILTTLDSATRITRYVTEELFTIKNRYLSTILIIVLAGALAMGKDTANNPIWQRIWPAFGASNQLVAALALLVITSWLLIKKRPTLYSLIPAVFMLLTSCSALGIQLTNYIKHKDYLLALISIVLMGSALFLIKEIFETYRRIKRQHS
ncbi:MAG: carbon starvation protein A [Candidatus Omnitrophota bacterium]